MGERRLGLTGKPAPTLMKNTNEEAPTPESQPPAPSDKPSLPYGHWDVNMPTVEGASGPWQTGLPTIGTDPSH
jgi:hypothetical protein